MKIDVDGLIIYALCMQKQVYIKLYIWTQNVEELLV